MAVDDTQRHQLDLQTTLDEVIGLLNKKEVINNLVQRSESHRHDLVQSLVEKQQLTALNRKLKQLHPADIAFVLEGLPIDQRFLIWDQLDSAERAAVFLELNDSVIKSLLGKMSQEEIVNVASYIESNQLAELITYLPEDIVLDVLNAIDKKSRSEVQSSLSFPKDSVGSLMDFDMVSVRASYDIGNTLETLRKNKMFPEKSDQLFVVSDSGLFEGVLSIKDLILNDADISVADVMIKGAFVLHTDDSLKDAASAFERYDLITVPVINLHGQLVGSLNVDRIVEYLEEHSQKELLSHVGLSEEEDLYAPVWKSAQNRWIWLGLNLCTAFIASRVIGMFEETIAQLVALAALLPIIASIGGNTGNQTVALMVRGLAMNQITKTNFKRFFMKEMSISLINGLVWGFVVSLFALIIYGNFDLALVMMGSMILTLLIAAFSGVVIPVTLDRFGRDPVMGSSVLLTAVIDCMGFFVFLGMAAMYLT
ncbi:MAG: magnesium transporter [Proteobacteria bacterium]|nr:magnesium transporter [Pseudomonadota bacterium]NOG61269.1 magnesium transporter [Pseudomonadota bacterium]